LRAITFKISNPPYERDPEDIILPDKAAQDPEEAGKPETVPEGEQKTQKYVKHGINIRIDKKEERKKNRKEKKKKCFPDGSVLIDGFGEHKKTGQTNKGEPRRKEAHHCGKVI
jgi:hypothetical protein